MRLSKIKLAGFKSFVDPTTVNLPSNLVGVVGPNGSGKSNIIDAVRWVMGESSAKNLRGESMADVIFNGSTARKPVGQASIELVFDNSVDGLGGKFANYNEISVKRLVSRDGQSAYFLNGTRCRRRDITDIFLGTGLGPRSYAIIEQGMISRMIEAKPEELRNTIEEAAGISKYKERRRETETRMRHTKENLDRLGDLREELDKQLDRLQRQSKTAERYKILKQEERTFKGQLLALQWRELDMNAKEKEHSVKELEVKLEAEIANQRSLEASIERQREAHTEEGDVLNEIQAKFYQIGAEISGKEQTIQHHKERQRQLQQDMQQVETSLMEANVHLQSDKGRLNELLDKQAQIEPELNSTNERLAFSSQRLEEAEAALQASQNEWDVFNQTANQPAQMAEVQRTRITHMEEQSRQLERRHTRLTEESALLNSEQLENEIQELDLQLEMEQEKVDNHLSSMQEAQSEITEQRQQNHDISQQMSNHRNQIQQLNGRIASLEALQEAALGKKSPAGNWLEQKGLSKKQRLAEGLEVESGWEKAVETVLGSHLDAICVESVEDILNNVGELKNLNLGLIEAEQSSGLSQEGSRLASKVTSKWSLSAFIDGVYCADDLAQALTLRNGLKQNESVITRDGIWLGKHWLRVNHAVDEKVGVLAREKELKSLHDKHESLTQEIEVLEEKLDAVKSRLQELESRRDEVQAQLSQQERFLGEIKAQRSGKQAKLDQIGSRRGRITNEQEEIQSQLLQNNADVQEARAKLETSLELMEQLTQKRQTLLAQRDELKQALDQARQEANTDRGRAQELRVEFQSTKTAIEGLQQNLQRVERQIEQMQDRKEALAETMAEGDTPEEDIFQELEALLKARVEVEGRLQEARRKVEAIDAELRELSEKRGRVEQDVQLSREWLQSARMDNQTLTVRRQTIQESLTEAGHELSVLFETLTDDASIADWENQLQDVSIKISRLGPINLAAIEEYEQEKERKTYLDNQNADLVEALTTLENAIRKIDRETRAKFKETFDKINEGIKNNFPKLFGGGQAYLELTGEDLLDTGVSIMARPPGKRISNIHLLSGGEKALTAVALVFSIFELNPAPFCMLDEVDAPLDEANVGRFCNLVKSMSERVQFIFITHNKATMEIAQHLNGVTMHEPGVSRMVTVDVEEAAELAAM